MAELVPTRPFLVHLADGRTWAGAQFTDGFVCVHHPDQPNICTIAVNVDGLLTDRTPEDPLHDARIEWQDGPDRG